MCLFIMYCFQRVNQCLRDACHDSGVQGCMNFIDCGHGNDYSKFTSDPTSLDHWNHWKSNDNATGCFSGDNFSFGIYQQAVNLTTKESIVTRYTYALFWGFQVSLNIFF